MNLGDRIEIKKPFHDGYRWVPAEVVTFGPREFVCVLTDGTRKTLGNKSNAWRNVPA